MRFTTRKPQVSLAAASSTFAELAKTTIRLHPRRGGGSKLVESRISGTFLWPQDEPWPKCEETAPPSWWQEEDWPVPENVDVPLVPVLQLCAEDCPNVEFRPGTDLFQVLWCPLAHEAPIFVAMPYAYWRKRDSISAVLEAVPDVKYAQSVYLPRKCLLNPEPVLEYPPVQDLSRDLKNLLRDYLTQNVQNLTEDDALDFYESHLSVCPSTKVGGYVHWVQEPVIPRCRSGHVMEHLLTLSDTEFDQATWERWCPIEDGDPWQRDHDERLLIQAPAFAGLNGNQILFVCRECEEYPVSAVFQR
jgi:hypothetical protein